MYPSQVRMSGMKGEATPAQVRYANDISRLLGVDLPERQTKQAYSDYINRHARRYKELIND